MTSATDWNKVHQTRHSRWRHLAWTFGGIGVGDLFAWWGCDSAHLPYPGLVAPTAEVAITAALLTVYGRYRLNSGVPLGEIVAPEDDPGNQDPFPLAWCRDGGQVEECVSRALTAESIDTRQIRALGHRGWGWESDIILKGATAKKVNAACEQLDAHFDIQHGGTLVETDPARASHITLRLVESDPFADMPIPQVHAPKSLSVKDLVGYGQCMDASAFELRLQGMSMLLVGAMGSAKTKGAIRSLLEAITACRDAIAIEMDPVKDGLSEFDGVMAAPPIRGPKACEEWLKRMVRFATGRAKVKSRLKMGDLWVPSPERPTVFVVVDEFIYLSSEGKSLAIELLRIGREVGVHVIFAAQEATEDSLGDAIANIVTYRVMLAARSEDIRLVFGTGASAMGYRPDRLVPAVDDEHVYDAGKFYIRGPGFLRPLQYRWHRLSGAQISDAVGERKAAGRPWFDTDSLVEAGLMAELMPFRPAGPQDAAVSLADRLEALDTEQADAVAKLLRLFDREGADFLPTAPLVTAAGLQNGAELQGVLASLVPGATSSRPRVDGVSTRGWDRQVIEQAAAALFAPV